MADSGDPVAGGPLLRRRQNRINAYTVD